MVDIAVIDVGSNSVRLMTKNARGVQKQVKITQLGKGVASTRQLSQKAVEDTVKAISEFLNVVKGVKTYVFATEAVRIAENGKDFLKKVKEECGVDIDLLTPNEEAKAGFLGASKGRNCTVIDIGGASTEFARGDKGEIERAISNPVGAVKLFDIAHDDELRAKEYLFNTFGEFEFSGEILGIGGTVTTLGALALNLLEYDSTKIDGYILTKEQVENLARELIGMSVDERMKRYPVLPEKRANIVASGAILLSYIMNKYDLRSIKLSESDNTEGYLILRNYEN